jgi:RNA polymerase sigma-70 factor, ECF subfamily
MDNSDPELVAKCCAGDACAFEELLLRHQDAVFNLAWRMTGNWHDAADLTQETFIRVYRKLTSYRSEYAFRNWALSICANLTKNLFRGNSRRQHKEDELALVQEMSATPAVSERDEGLEVALRQLPESLRVALVLKHMEGLSYEEIAQTLGIGVSAAKMRVARGRDELARLLEPRKGELI